MSEIAKMIPEWLGNIVILIVVPSVAIWVAINWKKYI